MSPQRPEALERPCASPRRILRPWRTGASVCVGARGKLDAIKNNTLDTHSRAWLPGGPEPCPPLQAPRGGRRALPGCPPRVVAEDERRREPQRARRATSLLRPPATRARAASAASRRPGLVIGGAASAKKRLIAAVAGSPARRHVTVAVAKVWAEAHGGHLHLR